ncbi:MAG: chorismate--pyruvate lyase family protein [Methylococcus sp.]
MQLFTSSISGIQPSCDAGERFNPFDDLVRDRDVRSASANRIDLPSLTPFQRSLLTIDGTVTKYLESYALEPIEVVALRRETQTLPARHSWLETPPETEVIAREVLLQGARSTTVYAYAVSLLVPSRLPPRLLGELEREPGGIGRVLLRCKIESRREVLWYGREHFSRLPSGIRAKTGDEFLSRCYTIIVAGLPVMLINERFPLALESPGSIESRRPEERP